MLSALMLLALAGRAAAGEAPWTPLFDGKTLKGWVQKGGNAKYQVENGTIVGSSVPNTKNSFLCTERSYGDFVLELEFKADPKLNSGVQIRGQSRPDYQDGRVHGYQVEIDPDVERGRMWTGGLYDEGRRGWLVDLTHNEPARKAFRPGQWNRFRVEARGDSIKTWLNGVAAADLLDAKDQEGFIGLQVHQVGKREEALTVAWRNIRIQDLGRRVWRPLWNGKDLKGLHAAGGGSWTLEGDHLLGKSQRSDGRAALLFADSDQPARDFTARAEVRLRGGNGGLYLNAQPASSPAGATGLQVDLDGAGVGLYEVGGAGWIARPGGAGGEADGPPEGKGKARNTWKAGDWNWVTISARDRRLVVQVNDRPVLTHTLGETSGAGALALEVAGGQDARLEVRHFERLSDAVPPPVPGYPVGWCIRASGSAPDDAKAAGFEYVELALQDVLDLPDAEMQKAAERFRNLGIPALSGYNLIPADLKVVGPEADTARQDQHLARALPRAAQLGVKYVILNNGPSRKIPEGTSRQAAWKQLVAFSKRLAQAAKGHGLTVLVEPMRSTDTNLVTTVAEAVDLVKAVRQPNFQMMVDYSFITIEKEDPSVLRKARPYLRHLHIANPDGRGYPMKATAGEADYRKLFAVLREIRYRGGMSVHARTDNFFADAPRALALLRQSAATLAK